MLLKLTFLAFKKVVQVVQNGGKGGGNLDKIQKNSSFSSGERPSTFANTVFRWTGQTCILRDTEIVLLPPLLTISPLLEDSHMAQLRKKWS